MKLGLVISKKIASDNATVEEFLDVCAQLGIETLDVSSSNTEKIDFFVTFGGDGTILYFAKQRFDKPILSVNMGHVGFLSNIQANREDFETKLSALQSGKFSYIERSLLQVKFDDLTFTAVNEIVLANAGRSEVATISVEMLGESLSLVGDGVIVGTPSGSTAYSLTVGGPAISVDSNVFFLTPLGNRFGSLVYSDDNNMILRPSANDKCELYVDGKLISEYNGQPLELSKSPNRAKFVKFEDNFLTKLKMKLSVGF